MKIHCPHLSQFPRIRHAFFEENTDPVAVRRDQAIQAVAEEKIPLLVLKQVHGTTVLSVTTPWNDVREGDGLVTSTPGIALGVETADCGPVLFYDPQAHVIGACHAGWKGAQGGIIQETLKAMEKLGAQRTHIHATLGPTIQQQNYEVGPEFPDLIGEPYNAYFYTSPKAGHHYFNLPRYIQDVLKAEGIGTVHDLQQDTFSSRFSSRRRTFAADKDGVYHSGLSLIFLT